MLQKLNERIQGIVAWLVIGLIAITFTLFGVDYYMQSHHAADVEITINNQAISKNSYETAYRRMRQQKDPSQLTVAGDQLLKKQILDDMVKMAIATQAAKQVGFAVTADQANQIILSIPQFQEDGKFSVERYIQSLNAALYTPESFQKEVKQSMLLNQQRFTFVDSAFALPTEMQQFIKLLKQTRDYDYIKIPAASFLDKQQFTEDQLSAYYKAHEKEFIEPAKVSIDFVRLSMPKVKQSIVISDEELERYYQENEVNFRTPAQWLVSHILIAVPPNASQDLQNKLKLKAQNIYGTLQKHPEQFESLVKTESSDKLSAATKGLLPWITAGQTEFDKALSSLEKPNQVSSPVRTNQGYEIFKLIDYKPVKVQPFTTVKQKIKDQLTADALQTKYAQLSEKLSELSYQTPDSLAPVAKELNLDIEHSDLFTKAGTKTGLPANKQIINSAFSHEVLQLGNNSEPIQLDNETLIVLRVSKNIPAAKKPLNEVSDKIKSILANAEASKKTKEAGTALLTKNKIAKQHDLQINANHYQWQNVKNATRELKTEANDLAFSLPRVNTVDGHQLANGDYIIIRLNQIKDGQYDSLDKKLQANLIQQVTSNYGQMDYNLYIADLIKKAKIVKNN
jgi:peptidyl-prolyl cis-trans isomerase D